MAQAAHDAVFHELQQGRSRPPLRLKIEARSEGEVTVRMPLATAS